MKKFLILGLISFVVSFSACDRKTKDSDESKKNDSLKITTIKFDEITFDFGTITQGEIVEHIYKFTNTGKYDLKIDEVQKSCGCTTSDNSKDVVKPGEKGQINVKFNSEHKEGNYTKNVTVYANTDPDATVLRFTVNVKVPKENK